MADRNQFRSLFPQGKPLIAMLHLFGRGGVCGFNNALEVITKRAVQELDIFQEEGIDGVIVENYSGEAPQMAIEVLRRVMQVSPRLKVGLNILPNDLEASPVYAHETGAHFVQADYVAGEYEGAPKITQFGVNNRRNLFQNIALLGGVWPKYYTPAPRSYLPKELEEGRKRCDAIVVTGTATGVETPIEKIKRFREVLGDFPLVVGAGLTPQNAQTQLAIVDGAIVGSGLKYEGRVENEVDRARVKEYVAIARSLRH